MCVPAATRRRNRQVILFLPDWLEKETAETISPIRCLRASFRAEKPLSHRDFLGSLMGMALPGKRWATFW